MSRSLKRLEQLLQQREQMNAKIREQEQMVKAEARDIWGVVVERLLRREIYSEDYWVVKCKEVLSGQQLERALGFLSNQNRIDAKDITIEQQGMCSEMTEV